jgi:hypothetical protein
MKTPPTARSARKSSSEERPRACATIHVATAPHLCQVQAMTRELCRSIGLGEPVVFQAVIAVTELAHRLFIERSLSGDIELSAVRRKSGLGLEIRAEGAGAPGVPPVRVSLTFPLASASPYS